MKEILSKLDSCGLCRFKDIGWCCQRGVDPRVRCSERLLLRRLDRSFFCKILSVGDTQIDCSFRKEQFVLFNTRFGAVSRESDLVEIIIIF